MNAVKTALLLGMLSLLLLGSGYAIGGEQGAIIALAMSLLMNIGTYWFSDKMAISMARAQPADPERYAWFFEIVERLSTQAEKPMPDLYISPSPQPNAFATGRNPRHAAVCVNQGLLELLNAEEIEGVLAHELSHVYNRDILIGTIAATIATAITFVARMGMWGGHRGRSNDNPFGGIGAVIMLVAAPLAATLIQLAVTRSRETQADASGAALCGKPLALASALKKLEDGGKQLASRGIGGVPSEMSNGYQSLYISAPFGETGPFKGMFRTHPSTAERVAKLEQIAREMGQLP